MFQKAYKEKYAIGCFNIDSYAMIQAVLKAAQDNHSPVIISISKGSREFLHPGNIKNIINEIAKDISIPFAIHLDHGKSVELCKECIDEGFTSVMIDASAYSYEENIRQTKEVVTYAHLHNCTVEGELGGLEAGNGINSKYNNYTDPLLAKDYILRTGIDSLAVSVGTGHGTRKFKEEETPNLKWEILGKIQEELPGFPLVLHGSSSIPKELIETFNQYGGNILNTQGIPVELLKKAIAINVCKINIGTDFRVAYTGALRKSLSEIKDKYEPRNFLVPAKEACYKLVEHKIRDVFSSANKAR